MVSKVDIYNAALGHLGPVRLANVNENRGDRRELDAVYESALDYMLQQGNWKFALRTVRLAADGDLAPQVGTSRQYAFALPDDYVPNRITGIAPDENFVSELFDWDIEGGVLYGINDTIWIQYVSKGEAYGRSLGLYTPLYVEALGAWLAFKASLPITKDKVTKETIYNYHIRFLARARENEALADRVQSKPQGNWGRSRGYSPGRSTFFAPGKMGWRG
jgi:hypothetical protein